MSLQTMILLGGVCHFGILIASALVPRVLDWRAELKALSPLSRHLVWTHGAFIVLVIIAFGTISVVHAAELANGAALARSFCAFIAGFWLVRLMIQFFLFDARPYLKNTFLKVGYHSLTIVFAYLSIAYGWAALRGQP